MENFKFNEELLREGYQFLANNKGNGAYVVLEDGDLTDDCAVDFKNLEDYFNINLEDYFNIKEKLSDDKYLLVIYDRKSRLYKVMFVNKKLIIGYPFLAKLFGKHKVAAVEVQGILSILNAKLRQQSLLNSEIKRTAMENIQPLKRSRINKRGKN